MGRERPILFEIKFCLAHFFNSVLLLSSKIPTLQIKEKKKRNVRWYNQALGNNFLTRNPKHVSQFAKNGKFTQRDSAILKLVNLFRDISTFNNIQN